MTYQCPICSSSFRTEAQVARCAEKCLGSMEDGPPSPAKKKAKSPANGRTQRRKSVSKKEEPGSGGKRGKRGTNQAAVPAVVGPLTETHIFLDVRSETGEIDVSTAFKNDLMRLGATISETHTSQVTHVVFKNGKKSTLTKARRASKQGKGHLVSVAWVAACASSSLRELESEYPISDTATPIKRGGKSMKPISVEASTIKHRKRRLSSSHIGGGSAVKTPAGAAFRDSPSVEIYVEESQLTEEVYVEETQLQEERGESAVEETQLDAGNNESDDLNMDEDDGNESEDLGAAVAAEDGEETQVVEPTPARRRRKSTASASGGGRRNSAKLSATPRAALVNGGNNSSSEGEVADEDETQEVDATPVRHKRKRRVSPRSAKLDTSLDRSKDANKEADSAEAAEEPSTPQLPIASGRMAKRAKLSSQGSDAAADSDADGAGTDVVKSTRVVADSDDDDDDDDDDDEDAEPASEESRKAMKAQMAKLGALLGLPETTTSPVSEHDSDIDPEEADADGDDADPAAGSITAADAMDADLDADETAADGATATATAVEPKAKAPKTKKKATQKTKGAASKKAASPAAKKALKTKAKAKKAAAPSVARAAAAAAAAADGSDEDEDANALAKTKEKQKKKQQKGKAGALKKTKGKGRPTKRCIAISGLDPSDRDCVLATIKHVKGAVLAAEVDENTTHVVASGKRTIKVLSGIACGCKLVSPSWALASLEAGEWIDEAAHLLDAFPAAAAARKSMPSGQQKSAIFSDVGQIYVSRTRISPSQPVILQLLAQSSATIAATLKTATVRVGGMAAPEGGAYVSVNERWIFDSITEQKAMPLKDYTIAC